VMFKDDLNVDPGITDGIKHASMLLPLIGAPLALGAMASVVIGGFGLGAAATAALAAPLAGKLFKSPKQLLEKVVSCSEEFVSEKKDENALKE